MGGSPPSHSKDTGKKSKAAEKKSEDKRLDEALEESFPASDPVSLAQPSKSKEDKRNP